MSIRASAATRNITPTRLTPLAGYPGQPRVATSIRDPLLVSALHLRGGSGGIIALSLDLFAVDPTNLRLLKQRIVQATGTRESNIFIATTRNRAAPWTWRPIDLCHQPSYSPPDPAYMEFVIEQSVQAAAESAVASRPANLAILPLTAPGTGALVVRETPTNRILAILAVLEQPVDILGPLNTTLSAGPLNAARTALAAQLGGKPVLVYFLGAQAEPTPDTTLPDHPQPDPDSVGIAMAAKLANLVQTTIPSAFSDKLSFSGELLTVDDLEYRTLPSEPDALTVFNDAAHRLQVMRQCNATPDQLLNAAWNLEDARSVLAAVGARKSGLAHGILDDLEPIQLHLLRIGAIKLLGLPLALATSTAQTLVSKVGPELWLAQSANGDLQGSTLLCDETIPGRCRLAGPLFNPESGGTLTQTALELAR